MCKNTKLIFILSILLIGGVFSVDAKGTPQPDFKKEINALSKQLEATKVDLAALRKEVEAIKNQKCATMPS